MSPASATQPERHTATEEDILSVPVSMIDSLWGASLLPDLAGNTTSQHSRSDSELRKVENPAAENLWHAHAHMFGLLGHSGANAAQSEFIELLERGRREFDIFHEQAGFSVSRSRSVLEIGCGIGRLSFAMAEVFGQVVGIDVCNHLLETAQSYNVYRNLSFEPADGRRLQPRSRQRFDTVIAYDVAHFLDHNVLSTYLSDTRSLLRSGGELVFRWNSEQMQLKTRASLVFRRGLHVMGKTSWKGWPTAWSFRRRVYSVPAMTTLLHSHGFDVAQVDSTSPASTSLRAIRR